MAKRIQSLLLMAIMGAPALAFGVTASIDSNTTNQYIRGFGVSSAWCSAGTIAPAAAALWADDNTDGHAGLTILRTRIDPGGAFANEAGPMTQARAQNPNVQIFSTMWTPPAAYKNNNSLVGPGANNTFNNTPANSTAYANYLINYIKTIKSSYGIDLYAVSPQNEPDWNTSYESCLWTAAQFNDFVKTYFFPAIQGNSLPTKVMIPESFSDNLGLAATAMNDAVTAPMVSIIGNHLYGGGPRPLSAGGFAHLTNQESWETEMSDVSGAPHDPGMAPALQIAGWMHNSMVTASMNAYLHWWIYAYGGSNEGLFGTDCTTQTRKLAAMGNFSKFVRPGWYRMGGTITGNAGVNISAYKNVAGAPGKFAIVAINTTNAAVSQTFSFSNFNATSVTPWITDSSRALVRQAAVAVSGGSFTYTLPPQSLVSFPGSCTVIGTPSSTPTCSGTPTLTPTATATPSRTFSPSPTMSPTPSFSTTPSPSLSATGTLTQSRTVTATFSSTLTLSPGSTATSTPSRTSTPSFTPTSTITLTPSPPATLSPVQSATSSATLTSGPGSTSTLTRTQTSTPLPTFTQTPAFSNSQTHTLTPTSSPTPSHTSTPSWTATASATLTQSPLPTLSFTPTRSATTVPSKTASPTSTGTAAASPQDTTTPTPTSTMVIVAATATPEPPKIGKLTVMPNPVHGPVATLYPPYFAGTVDAVVQIYSVSYFKLGQVEFNAISWHPLSLELKDRWGNPLPQGLYFVVFKTAKNRSIAKMLILN